MKNVSRAVALVAAAALSAAGLVGTATTSATAAPAAPAAKAKAPVATSYTCVTGLGEFELPMSIATSLPASVKAKKTVPAKAVKLEVTVPASVVGMAAGLLNVTALGGKIAGDATAGKTVIGLAGTFTQAEIADPAADLVITGKGKTAKFKIAKPGTYVVKAPKTVSFTPVDQAGTAFIGAISCNLTPGAAAKLATIKVTKK